MGKIRNDSPSRATLVTGCSSGIGRAIAIRIAAEGWPVYATARRRESILDLTDHGCRVLPLDVTDESSRRAAVDEIVDRHGAVSALVNNAGYGQQGACEEVPLSAFRRQFETNVFGAVALCQLVLPGMRRLGWGRIVNLSSMGGRVSFPGGAAYHGSKYALEAISDVLRFEVEGFGIRVVVVEPGPTSTDFGAASLATLEDRVPAADGAYESFNTGIRRALESTFSDEGGAQPGATTPEAVAEAVWTSLETPDPEPRVVVGRTAEELIRSKQAGSDRDWDRLVGSMYPRPGPGRADEAD